MIKKTSKGYKVVSLKGKNLSKDNLSYSQAVRRLEQIEYYKHLDSKNKEKGKDEK